MIMLYEKNVVEMKALSVLEQELTESYMKCRHFRVI
jgi:hypothetical protein